MTQSASNYALTPWVELPEAAFADRERWLDLAAATLTPRILLLLEVQECAVIDARYPDDPGSLWNGRYRQGQRRKRRVRRLFDDAHQRLTEQLLGSVERMRTVHLAQREAAVADALYLHRSGMALEREAHRLAAVVRAGLAYDRDLQADLVRGERSFQQHRQEADDQYWRLREQDAWHHQQVTELRRVEAEIAEAATRLDQPYQLAIKLYDVLQAMAQYQMTLADRASRNPALADRLRMMSLGLTAVMTSVQGLIKELNDQGEYAATSQQVRDQSELILAMAMEQMQQWQQETRQEPHA